MSQKFHDPELIGQMGDSLERHFTGKILNSIPSYATFWATYIGNDGNHHYLPMIKVDADIEKKRVQIWEQLYTLFESLCLCWTIETQLSRCERIANFEDYALNLNSWIAFYAHLGRIHDTAERVATQLKEKRLYECFDPFYEKRHIAVHGIKVPMRWIENVLSAPTLGEERDQWHSRKEWSQLGRAEFEFLSSSVSKTLRELEVTVEFFFNQVFKLVQDRLGLRPIQWPTPEKITLSTNVENIPFAGTQSFSLYSGTLNVSGIHPESDSQKR